MLLIKYKGSGTDCKKFSPFIEMLTKMYNTIKIE